MKDTTEIIEGLQKHVAKQVNEPKSLSEMEGQIRKLMRVIGRLLLQVWLIWEESKIAKDELQCSCGKSLSKQRRKAMLIDKSKQNNRIGRRPIPVHKIALEQVLVQKGLEIAHQLVEIAIAMVVADSLAS